MSAPTLVEGPVESPLGEVALWRCDSEQAAAAAPIVYLHSAGGETGPMVSGFLEALAERGRQVLAPMMPGFGGSEGVTEIEDVEDLVFHLLDLFDSLDLTGARRPHLAGLSLGGWLAAELACRYPDSVRSVTLVNPAGLYIEGFPIGEIFGRQLDELAEAVFASRDHPIAQMMRLMGETLRADPAAIPFETLRPFLEAQAAAAKVAWNPYLHNPRLRRRLRRITAPVLVVNGLADGLIPSAHGEAYAAEIPDARLETLAGGHMLPLELPAELAQLIAAHAADAEARPVLS